MRAITPVPQRPGGPPRRDPALDQCAHHRILPLAVTVSASVATKLDRWTVYAGCGHGWFRPRPCSPKPPSSQIVPLSQHMCSLLRPGRCYPIPAPLTAKRVNSLTTIL